MNNARAKLEELEKFVGRNPSDVWNEELVQLEAQVSKMEKYEDFLSHPVSRVVINRVIDWVNDCNMILLREDSVKESERMKMISRRETLLDILAIFSPRNVKRKTLEQYVDKTIQEFREYYK